MRGFIVGILGLTLLQVAVSHGNHTAAVIAVPTSLLSRWLNPNIPLIPDRRTS